MTDLVRVDFDDLSREEAIDLLRISMNEQAQSDHADNVLHKRMAKTRLTKRQRLDLETYKRAKSEIRQMQASAVKTILITPNTIN